MIPLYLRHRVSAVFQEFAVATATGHASQHSSLVVRGFTICKSPVGLENILHAKCVCINEFIKFCS